MDAKASVKKDKKEDKFKDIKYTPAQDVAILKAGLSKGISAKGSSQLWQEIADELKASGVVDYKKNQIAYRYQTLVAAYGARNESEDNLTILKDNGTESDYEDKAEVLEKIAALKTAKSPAKKKEPKTPIVVPSVPAIVPTVIPVVEEKKTEEKKAEKKKTAQQAVSDDDSENESNPVKRILEDEEASGSEPPKKKVKTAKERKAEKEAEREAFRELVRQETIKELFEATNMVVPAGNEFEAWKYMRDAAMLKVRAEKELENKLAIEKMKIEFQRESEEKARELEKWKTEQLLAVEAAKAKAAAAKDEMIYKLVNEVISLKKH